MNNKEKLLVIDGSIGGGSIVRISLAFSILTKTPIKIINIRAKREQPGLKEQHLQGVLSLVEFCGGKIKGAYLGSREIEFYPSNEFKKDISVKIATAGSVGLVLYPLILASLATKELVVRIKGGATFGKWAPPITFLENVTFEMLRRIGIDIELNVIRHGFYPKGGAEVLAKIRVKDKLRSLRIENCESIERITTISIASKDLKERNVAERQNNAFMEELKKILEDKYENNKILERVSIKEEYVESFSSGTCITSFLNTKNYVLGSSALGEIKIRAEELGRQVAKNLLEIYSSGATVDEHLADQLIPFLAIAGNSIIIAPKITEHIENSVWLSNLFTKREILIKENKIEIL